jgi:hypothetical protein
LAVLKAHNLSHKGQFPEGGIKVIKKTPKISYLPTRIAAERKKNVKKRTSRALKGKNSGYISDET